MKAKKYKVLIVDDYAPLGQMLAMLFQTRGPFRAHFVDNFDQALKEAKEFRPDICVLDLWEDATERLRGEAVAAAFLEDPVLRRVPIVYYTASKRKKSGNIVENNDFHGGLRIVMPPTRPDAAPSELLTKGRTNPVELMDELLRVLQTKD